MSYPIPEVPDTSDTPKQHAFIKIQSSVPCPTCYAQAGYFCETKRGTQSNAPHCSRSQVYFQLIRKKKPDGSQEAENLPWLRYTNL